MEFLSGRVSPSKRAVCGPTKMQPLDIGVLPPKNDDLSCRRKMQYSRKSARHKMCHPVNPACTYIHAIGATICLYVRYCCADFSQMMRELLTLVSQAPPLSH